MTLPEADATALANWGRREPTLTKPAGSLGRLEDISRHMAAWQGHHPPRLARLQARVFAGNHGVAMRGVSAYPAAVTEQMVLNFHKGGAAINQLCQTFGIALSVDALSLARPTADFTLAPAMREDELREALDIGLAAAEPGIDLLILGEMGIANTTSAAALCLALFGGAAEEWTGRGTGIDDRQWQTKRDVVQAGVDAHPSKDPLRILQCLGGRELAAIVGAVAGARLRRIPVMLDGYVCTAAAATLQAMRADALDHCLVGHVSAEPGHRRLLQRLGKQPLLDLAMRLGEASGAALAAALVIAALACHNGMSTFAEAGVSDKDS